MTNTSTALLVGVLLAAAAVDAGWLHMDLALHAAQAFDTTVTWVSFWR